MDKLYERKIISRDDKAVLKPSKDRYDNELLLEMMLTRSWDDCVKFAVILSETEGVDDLGRKLLDDAGVRKEEIVGSQETLRKLRAENEMLAEEAKAAARKAKEERLLRLAYQIGRGGEEEVRVLSERKVGLIACDWLNSSRKVPANSASGSQSKVYQMLEHT
jgi:hypothetical protein